MSDLVYPPIVGFAFVPVIRREVVVRAVAVVLTVGLVVLVLVADEVPQRNPSWAVT